MKATTKLAAPLLGLALACACSAGSSDGHGGGSSGGAGGVSASGGVGGADAEPWPSGGWVEVPAGQPLTIAVASSDNFGNHAFAGCQRGAATQSPWVTSPPGAQLGCVYVNENVVLQAGKHYFWQYGNLTELPTPAPPKLIVDAFKLPGVGIDVTKKDNCKL